MAEIYMHRALCIIKAQRIKIMFSALIDRSIDLESPAASFKSKCLWMALIEWCLAIIYESIVGTKFKLLSFPPWPIMTFKRVPQFPLSTLHPHTSLSWLNYRRFIDNPWMSLINQFWWMFVDLIRHVIQLICDCITAHIQIALRLLIVVIKWGIKR